MNFIPVEALSTSSVDVVVKKAEEVIAKNGVTLDYKVGTMIELPRACVNADEIAQEAGIFEENKTYKPIPIVVGGNHLLPAIEKEIVEFNPLIGMDFGQFKFKSENKKKTTYTSDERNQIMEFVGEDDLYDLGIKLDFCLPLRIGELKGLRFDDVEGDSIQICRFVDDKHKVVDDIKGHASAGKRFIPLIPEAKRIISRIRELNPDSEYLFMVDLEKKAFLTTVTFNRRLKKYCNALGIKYRSSHDLRFSVASILFKNGVTVPEIQEIIGHTTDSMTHHYLKNIDKYR